MEKILIIDDEKSICDLLSVVFGKQGYEVKKSYTAAKALELIESEDFDLILTDIRLPERSGMYILKQVKKTKPGIPVIMITAYGTIKQAVDALKAGAADYVMKPFDMDELKIIVANCMEKKRLQEENVFLKKELSEKYSFENIVGKSKKMIEIFSLIEKIAGIESTVLIRGESGTGKEMAARAIHYLSRRKERPFVTINCGALPEGLLESELFGHVKGAFTGAVVDKKGMFEVAHKGTLFLDEVGETSQLTQVKLLRALQEKTIRRVGGTSEIPVDVRIISATNQDLKRKIENNEFREDLYYRLNVISFEMPPLREKKEDIPLLVNYFIKKHCEKVGRKMKRVAPEVMSLFESYLWPGNIRELENVIERIVAIEDRETITEDCLPEELLAAHGPEIELAIHPGFNLNETVDTIAKQYVQQALYKTGGNMKEAATVLGINYRSLRYLIEKYQLKDFREDDDGA
ncbi:MAG: sigma-54-dependent Fis family transcriptional regulator [Candidatus Aminicenantes bacterium]|nr:sigma-54-dependent Fis family transcriptional regulator [Candidatus Aminicenantes bacterium]